MRKMANLHAHGQPLTRCKGILISVHHCCLSAEKCFLTKQFCLANMLSCLSCCKAGSFHASHAADPILTAMPPQTPSWKLTAHPRPIAVTLGRKGA